MSARLYLRPDVELRVSWRDGTPFGTPVTGRPDDEARRAFAPVVEALAAGSSPAIVYDALAAAVDSPVFAAMADVRRRRGRLEGWELHPEVRLPDPEAAPPGELVLTVPDGTATTVAVPAGWWGPLHEALAGLAGGGLDPDSVAGEMRGLVDGLVSHRWVVPAPIGVGDEVGDRPGLTFVGHNTIAVRSATTQVLVDPFLRPTSPDDDADYRPLGPSQLGRIDAVALTHGHPDHFDPGTLLQLDPRVPVIVPAQERETLLAPDLAVRLGQLGFTDVRPRAWGAVERVGDVDVHVLPFRGEQPTAGARLHPEVRMVGNTYVVRTPEGSVAVTADAGADGEGDAVAVAAAHRRDHGPVDVVLSGYRGWFAYPAQHLLSSVARYAWFVPPELWGTRQQIMCDPDGAVTVAEAFGAGRLVPVAAGGAPWFWRMGLGPVLAGPVVERPGFDPRPERVAEAAAVRSRRPDGTAVASAVEVLVLRPGDILDADGTVRTLPGHGWPYG